MQRVMESTLLTEIDPHPMPCYQLNTGLFWWLICSLNCCCEKNFRGGLVFLCGDLGLQAICGAGYKVPTWLLNVGIYALICGDLVKFCLFCRFFLVWFGGVGPRILWGPSPHKKIMWGPCERWYIRASIVCPQKPRKIYIPPLNIF